MPRGFAISIQTLTNELRDAKAAGRTDEARDLDFLLNERADHAVGSRPTAAQRVDLQRARNRQSQRRYHRRAGEISLAPGDRIYDPWKGGIVRVTSATHFGRKWMVNGTYYDGSGWYGTFSASTLRALRRVEDEECVSTVCAGCDAARDFLETLDAFVAGDVDEVAYADARRALAASL